MHLRGAQVFNARMKRIEQIWYENVRELLRLRYDGKPGVFANAIEKSPSLMSGYLSDKPRRKFGVRMIRHIESVHGFKEGFLDKEHAFSDDTASGVLLSKIASDFISLPVVDQIEVYEEIQRRKRAVSKQ